MSLLGRTISSFPMGRTTEELLVLLDADFDPKKRTEILSEFELLLDQGVIRRDRKGRWFSLYSNSSPKDQNPSDESGTFPAVIAKIAEVPAPEENKLPTSNESDQIDPNALLRYYRSTLRSDPRGAIVESEDKHGISWQVVTGPGSLAPDNESNIILSFELDSLPNQFREAVFKREGEENVLAVGWPVAVGRKSGIRAFWPVGMLSGKWERDKTTFKVLIEKNDVLVNPDWIKFASTRSTWSKSKLTEVFLRSEGTGLTLSDFTARLREAAATKILTPLTPNTRALRLNLENEGIHNLIGLFLPTETSFNAGAARDLDLISNWNHEKLRQTALAEVLGLVQPDPTPTTPVINFNSLNAEQIQAVKNACTAKLTVVSGPPGTGKSQAIVSMVTSILADGGSVLFASRNHHALDAVEERLSEIANDVTFSVRTIDPNLDIDMNFSGILRQLVSQPSQGTNRVSIELISKLNSLALLRSKALDDNAKIESIHIEMADLVERLEVRQHSESATDTIPPAVPHNSFWQRLLKLIFVNWEDKIQIPVSFPLKEGAPTHQLKARLQHLRQELEKIGDPEDPVLLTEEISEITKKVMPSILAKRANLSLQERQNLGEQQANLEIQQSHPDRALAKEVISHRPLWLASVLGTPRRIPLIHGLFDLVIFDEASQCDIASSLPLFARARRAVVVGDDNQLSFIPQLGLAHDRNLMLAQSLVPGKMGKFSQSRRSLFGMMSLIPGTKHVMLRNQYRSAATIVDYINTEFYGGKLLVAGDQDALKFPRNSKPGIAWTNVSAPHIRQVENVNQNETLAIIKHLDVLLNKEKYDGSIGIITPFRPQAAEIWSKINKEFKQGVIEKAKLRAGTVDSFQGQERDVILFSPCLGPTSNSSALTFVQRDWRRLNVAISRARAIAHVFGDLDFARKGSVHGLRSLASWATEPRVRKNEGIFDSNWERRVYEALKKRGLKPIPQYEIAGRRLDFALFGRGEIKLDLEVDGRYWHTDIDGKRKTSDLWRDCQLKSLGWRVRRFWVDELANNLEECLDIIEKDLG